MRLKLKLRSLRVRLLLMFMLVVMVALITAEGFANQTTSNAFETYIRNGKSSLGTVVIDKTFSADIQTISYELATAYKQDPGSIPDLLDRSAAISGTRIILVNSSMQVIADSAGATVGQTITSSKTPLDVNKTGTSLRLQSLTNRPILVISTDMSLPVQLRPISSSPEQSFLGSVKSSFWEALLLAGVVALLLALLCSYQILKPIRALTEVANRMERGDLSQRVKTRSKDEIGKLAHAFNTMADSLARSEQLRRNMISDVAHELRTPLTNIRGYLEALQDRVVQPTQEIIASLYEESLLLSRLVADLQELSLAEAGQLYLVRIPVALEEIIVKAVYALQLQAESRQIAIHVDIPPGLPKIEADPERVGQILRNLLSNAITHTPIGGEISVNVWATGDEVCVRVQDSGEGIAAEHLPNIFERFYRADASRARATGGTGLGLAIVRQMVQAHGGRVGVESHPGQGACFTFTLPLATTVINQSPPVAEYTEP
jgi:signal transduction histidine kinase